MSEKKCSSGTGRATPIYIQSVVELNVKSKLYVRKDTSVDYMNTHSKPAGCFEQAFGSSNVNLIIIYNRLIILVLLFFLNQF